jgi:hypothetical protein
MDIRDYLEKAKELLQRDKRLLPVLFIETENQILVIGLAMDIGNLDRRKMMMDIGRNFAKEHKEKRIKSLSFIFEAWITRIDAKTNLSEKIEAIVVATWDIKTDKKDVITQDYEIIDDNVIWKGEPQGVDDTKAYILEAFMQGYNQHLNYKSWAS